MWKRNRRSFGIALSRLVWKAFIRPALPVLMAGAPRAGADPVTWTFQDVVFDDQGTASGTFVFDADTNEYSNISITTTAGTAFGGASYGDPVPVSPGNPNLLTAVPDGSLPDLTGESRLNVEWASPLTNDGGIAEINTAGLPGEHICAAEDCSALGDTRLIVSGRAIAPRVFLHYPLDGSGLTANGHTFLDDSGNNNHGTFVDLGTLDNTGFVDSPAAFGQAWNDPADGDEDRIDLTTPFAPGVAQPWAIAFWHDMSGGISMPLFDPTSTSNTFLVRADAVQAALLQIADQGTLEWNTSGIITHRGPSPQPMEASGGE